MLEIPLLQRPPFRFVDELLSLDPVARKAILRLKLERNQHRWSSAAALPGYLLIEAMAQAGGVLLRQLTAGEPGGLLVGVDQAQVPKEVASPAELRLLVQLISAAPPFFSLHAQACFASETVAHAQLQLMTHRSFL